MTNDVRAVALTRALQYLDSIGAKYKVIASDGSEYGELQVIEPRSSRAPLRYPRGTIREYIRPQMGGMAIGDVIKIPADQFGLETVQGSATSFASQYWGNGTVITRKDAILGVVEVLRVG